VQTEPSATEPAPHVPTGSSPYELFIVALSLLSLVNIVLLALPIASDTKGALIVLEVIMSLIFIGDFVQRLVRSDSKAHYFFRKFGWLDLLGSLPVPGLRLLRIARVVHLVRDLRRKGGRRMVREISAGRGDARPYQPRPPWSGQPAITASPSSHHGRPLAADCALGRGAGVGTGAQRDRIRLEPVS